MRFTGKVALVTGSTRGLGLEIARRLLAEGAFVVITGRNEEAGAQAVAALTASGGCASFVAADLTRPGGASRLIAETIAFFGALHILVNNAAPTDVITSRDSTVEGIDPADWEAILAGAATVTLAVSQAAIPELRKAGGGAIVNISTSIATRGFHGMVAHSASKAAIEAITRSLAVELGEDGIRANSLVLGFIISGPRQAAVATSVRGDAIRSTQLLPRFGEASDVSAAVTFLVSEDARFITGVSLHVDGGTSCRMPIAKLPDVGRADGR